MIGNLDIYYRLCISTLIAFILIIVLFVGFDNRVNEYEDYIGGLWVADEEFCNKSGVDSIMMFIGPPSTSLFSTERNCHILINNDYSNQGFTLKYRKNTIIGLPTVHHDYLITAETAFEEEPIMPESVDINISMMHNMMRIYDDETIYGIFYKDHETTDLCNLNILHDKDT